MQALAIKVLEALFPAIITALLNYWNKVQNDPTRKAELNALVNLFGKITIELADRVNGTKNAENYLARKKAEILQEQRKSETSKPAE